MLCVLVLVQNISSNSSMDPLRHQHLQIKLSHLVEMHWHGVVMDLEFDTSQHSQRCYLCWDDCQSLEWFQRKVLTRKWLQNLSHLIRNYRALRFQIASVHNLISALRYTFLQFLNFDTSARSVNFKQCNSPTSQPTLGQISGPCLHIFSFEFVLKLNFNFNFIGLSLRSWWFIFSLIWFCPCIYTGVYFDPHQVIIYIFYVLFGCLINQ